MLFLIRDVGPDWFQIRLADGKNSIARLPLELREFSRLLINTYAGAFTAYRPDTVIEYRPMRMAPGATEAVVRSLVKAHMGDSMQLDYYLELAGGAWKVVDINVLGARLIETYKNQFNGAISSDGIDGLIKTMAARNKATEERYRS